MRILLTVLLVVFSLVLGAQQDNLEKKAQKDKLEKELPPIDKKGAPPVRIGQLISTAEMARSYPTALRSLLSLADSETSIKVDNDPQIFRNFEDEGIFDCPFIYVNFVDRSDWKLTKKEVKNLKRYLENGGFIYIDAGINSEFLRQNISSGQHHSFADWSITPQLGDAFKQIFPGKKFKALPRAHKLYKVFYQGLPVLICLERAL